ncbi:MAG: hypothetical protein OEX98_02675 [Nitrosopumilus sp.]|nr:hypothetical protein [Nitrosopumilus sp.]
MNKNKIEEDPISTWDKMVHAPFKKIVKFDLVCIGIGIVIGIGIGAFLVKEVLTI